MQSRGRKERQKKIRIYVSKDRGHLAYRIYVGSREVLKTTRHDRAHEWIARTIPDDFVLFLVFTQPEIREKTDALIHILKLIPQARNRVGILVSYPLIDPETLECVRILKEYGVQIMLDSGAFHVLQRKVPLEQYLSWIDDYIEFVNRHIDLFDWIVTADVPCDSRPDSLIQKLPNRRKIELTIDNTLRIIDRIVDPRKFMVVIQGYYPEEYAFCCELYKRYGIVTAKVGVGSLCIRKYSRNAVQEIKQILETVRQHLPSWVKLHAFGLNIRFLKHREIFCLLHSSDSAAYAHSYTKYGRIKLFDPVTGTVKEVDVVKNGVIRYVDKVTIWFWILLSQIMQIMHLIEQFKQVKDGSLPTFSL